MPWFNVDDGFANSKPVLRIPRRYRCGAIGLWTLAGSWAAKELTDGFIPDHAVEEFAGTDALAEWLVRAGLWKKVEGGWQFEGWSKWQKTKERVMAFRAAETERKRNQRSNPKPAGGEGVSGDCPAGTDSAVPLGQDAPSAPCPGQPLPTPLPKPFSENLGGELTSVDADGLPPPYCPNHPGGTDKPCHACKRCRLEHQAAVDALVEDELASKREAKARTEKCLYCKGTGQVQVTEDLVKPCECRQVSNA